MKPDDTLGNRFTVIGLHRQAQTSKMRVVSDTLSPQFASEQEMPDPKIVTTCPKVPDDSVSRA